MAPVEPDPSAIVDVLETDAIPAIDDPEFTDDPDIADGVLVVGVVLDGEARAYPVPILRWHEIVNDAVAGRPLTVTYCPLCGTGLVFDRRVDGRTLTFGVSGKLYKNDLVLFDRETETLWSQLPGRALAGPLEGAELAPVATDLVDWASWRTAHPDTQVLVPPEGDRSYGDEAIDYDADPHPGYRADHDDIRFPVGNVDDRLAAKTRVAGVLDEDPPVAYPVGKLPDRGLVQDGDRLIVSLGGAVRGYRADGDWRLDGDDLLDQAGRRVDAWTGVGDVDLPELDVRVAYWFAWADFAPGTRIGPLQT